MSRLTIAAQTIKDTVSALEVGQALGLEVRHGRCRCPLHGGSDFNCVLYGGDRGFYCHVCKKGGDVIQFVREYHGTSFKNAVSWFDTTFHMGLNLDAKIDTETVRRAEKALQRRKEAHAFQEWRDGMMHGMAMEADRLVRRLEDEREANLPKTPGERWNDRFCEAVRLLPEAVELAEECETESIRRTGA